MKNWQLLKLLKLFQRFIFKDFGHPFAQCYSIDIMAPVKIWSGWNSHHINYLTCFAFISIISAMSGNLFKSSYLRSVSLISIISKRRGKSAKFRYCTYLRRPMMSNVIWSEFACPFRWTFVIYIQNINVLYCNIYTKKWFYVYLMLLYVINNNGISFKNRNLRLPFSSYFENWSRHSLLYLIHKMYTTNLILIIS